MADLPDELLVAYQDRELDPHQHAEVASQLAASPELRARLARFAATGRSIAPSFDQAMRQPVPDALLSTLLERPASATSDARPQPGLLSRLGEALERLIPAAPAPRLAVASFCTLLIGLGAGWGIGGARGVAPADSAGLLAFNRGDIIASGELLRGLESASSTERIVVPGTPTVVRTRLTFKSRDGGYCRQFEVVESTTAGHSGIGCRDRAGVWTIRVNLPVAIRAGSDTHTIPASGADTPLAGIVEQLADGDAFGPAEEAEAIRRRWQP